MTQKQREKSVEAPNPESPMPAAKVKNMQRVGSHFAALETVETADLQSQDSTSFEVQSARGSAELSQLEQCPSLVSEFENLPKFVAS
mgnify:CR=1 FL=1